MANGTLFIEDFLREGICEQAAWLDHPDAALEQSRVALQAIFAAFPTHRRPTEAETEDDLIWPVLKVLGWTDFLRQQNLAQVGRSDIPDGLLFADTEAKNRAYEDPSWKRFRDGLAIVESKRWNRPLDREDKTAKGDETAPSTQMLRYLRRIDDLTHGGLRWGILTNGRLWRLYWQGARAVSEDFFEIDLGETLGIAGCEPTLFSDDFGDADHRLKLFLLLFGRDAFIPRDAGRTFHEDVLAEGRQWEERVTETLSDTVFDVVFPGLARALATRHPGAPLTAEVLDDARAAALILLYRLLFVLYAEDRNLLPDETGPYRNYSLTRMRQEIARDTDEGRVFSDRASGLWSRLKDIFRAIGEGDDGLGIPPYNGGLFASEAAPLLETATLSDAVIADAVFRLSHQPSEDGPRYINYRDLSVQQLGSIYERIIEYEIVVVDGAVTTRLNPLARKGSGSYYTPEPLVRLVIERTVGPLVEERVDAFDAKAKALASVSRPKAERLADLEPFDPASRILELKICDPAMGSGHFLVTLVDWLADGVLAAMSGAVKTVEWAEDPPYRSPLAARIASIRAKILAEAREHNWPIVEEQLEDRHIVRRMILKRVVYGVDKNPMAVELAKLSLWLHTFTVGAPLSFLDHHLRCGDSLFGERVRGVMDALEKRSLLTANALARARATAVAMERIESLTDADITEVKASAESWREIQQRTAPLEALMDFIHALRWIRPASREQKVALTSFFDGQFGDVIGVLTGKTRLAERQPEQAALLDDAPSGPDPLLPEPRGDPARGVLLREMLAESARLKEEHRFLHWQTAFPSVWSNWESVEPSGGFDAVIGNPPWDRLKFQEVEWFAARKPEIAQAQRAADRKRMVAALKESGDPLVPAYSRAAAGAEAASRVARESGEYPLLSGGDINIYSLFVERAFALAKPDGMAGLLTPSGIASDKTAAPFFKSISTSGRLAGLFDFENRQPGFFPDVDSRFKFCALVAGGKARHFAEAACAFYLHKAEELNDPERCFALSADDFARVNPNTGTAPIFRSQRDAEITRGIYERLPVLVDRSDGEPVSIWPVRYMRMFDMTNDSHLFVTASELAQTGYPVGGNRWKRGAEEFLPLYVGRMIHQFDHRAASVRVNEANIHNAALSGDTTDAQHRDPAFAPTPQFWVSSSHVEWPVGASAVIGFRDIARATDAKTMIASFVPRVAAGNTMPLALSSDNSETAETTLLLGNFNALALDYVVRQKAQSTHLNWYIVEQLPVVALEAYDRRFGAKTAADIVREEVLALTYTAHDMAPFAEAMGYVDGAGDALPPFAWDEADRLRRRAKLDALYFMLYFPSKTADDIAALRETAEYIYSTFPIVEREERAAHDDRYLSRDLCLATINALAAGDPDADIQLN